MPRPESSESVKPVILESVTLIVELVALNQPGNFSEALFFIVNRLFAPETVKASLRKGEIESVWVVTIELSSTSSRSEEHTSELQSRLHLVCRLLLEKKKKTKTHITSYKINT